MNRSVAFTTWLVAQTILVAVYSFFAFWYEGIDFVSVFISTISTLGWNAQFGVDFSSYLLLSGLWVMWRARFATSALLLGLMAAILGFAILGPYLLYLLMKEQGDIRRVLVGDR